jgi:hypothetical protein
MLSYQIPLEYRDRGSAQESAELGVIGAISHVCIKMGITLATSIRIAHNKTPI